MRRIDLTGKIFGKLKVLKYVGKTENRKSIWLCQCTCGNKKNIKAYNLRCGDSKSCGCNHYLRIYEALYNLFKSKAVRAGHKVHLSYKDFCAFTKVGFCAYCGKEISWCKRNPRGKNQRTNLDRKDNSQGYSKENCVVCCKECNLIKGARFTYKQMKQIGALIKSWHM